MTKQAAASKPDPRVTKRRIEMRTVVARADGGIDEHKVTDYVRPDFLKAYVADARTRWQAVTVSDEPDAGPAGYHGQTTIPPHLDHPLAGQVFAATVEGG